MTIMNGFRKGNANLAAGTLVRFLVSDYAKEPKNFGFQPGRVIPEKMPK
jgi:hypothetical protein